MIGLLGLLLLALAAIIQSTLLSHAPFGLRPDLVLLLVVGWAMQRDVFQASLAGLIGGMMLDTTSFVPFGLNAALLSIIGTGVAIAENGVFRDNWPLTWATAGLATLGLHVGAALALQANGRQLPDLITFVRIVAPIALLNAALLPLVYSLIRRLVPLLSRRRSARV